MTGRSTGHYSYPIIAKDIPFYQPDNDTNDQQHYRPQHSSFAYPHPSQNQESNSNSVEIEKGTKELSFLKKILVVDNDPDITFTFKMGLEEYSDESNDNYNKKRFEVYTYTNPLEALREFKPNFYDLMLTDMYMPHMNGFELCEKLLELDPNVRVCFISSAEVNIEALREVYPKVSFGCFIKKPVTIQYLVKRLSAELD
jgi:CheY-like chemotaxis protein